MSFMPYRERTFRRNATGEKVFSDRGVAFWIFFRSLWGVKMFLSTLGKFRELPGGSVDYPLIGSVDRLYVRSQRQAGVQAGGRFLGMGEWSQRRVFVVAAVLLLASCSTSDDSEAVEEPTTTAAVAETTAAPSTTEATTTTLSDREVAEAELEAAGAEIEAAIEFWWMFPFDTSLGDEGLPLDVLTGPIRQRLVDLAASRTAAGEIQRSRGGERIEVTDIRVDMEAGIADIDVCSRGDDVLLDAGSGEQLAADDGSAWEGQAQAVLVDGTWLIEDYFSGQENGGSQCVFSD